MKEHYEHDVVSKINGGNCVTATVFLPLFVITRTVKILEGKKDQIQNMLPTRKVSSEPNPKQ